MHSSLIIIRSLEVLLFSAKNSYLRALTKYKYKIKSTIFGGHELLISWFNSLSCHARWKFPSCSTPPHHLGLPIHTLSKKRNATDLTVVIFSVLLIGLRVLVDSYIGLVIDLFGVFIQAERHLFQCVNPEFGASHGWSVVISAVCCSDRLFYLVITWSGANILPDFFFSVRLPGAA